MRLYIAVVESSRRKGRRVNVALHAPSKKVARAMVASRYKAWTIQSLTHAPGRKCISFQDEYPD